MNRLISLPILLLVLAASAAAADAPKVPATTRQLQLVPGADGHLALRKVEVPVPTPGDHEVLLHVHAVALQRGDIETLKAELPESTQSGQKSTLVAGSDAAGEIVRVGAKVHDFHVGQKVVSLPFVNYVESPLTPDVLQHLHGVTANGVYGDYVTVEETGIAPMPEGMSYEEAATLPSSALTGWTATLLHGYVHKGDFVLVEGTGGVSTFALQFAVAGGARVIVTSSSDDKLKRAVEQGAWRGINYRKSPDWSAQVAELTGGHGADLVIDIGGRSTIEQSVKALAYEGTVALVGGLGGYEGTLSSWSLIEKGATARGIIAGPRTAFVRMCDFMQAHHMHPLIERTYAFDDYERAMADLESGNFVGKLVMKL
jgi:NADPH:quinone reductase-like Zn-dependent oxidoreductase